MADDRNNPGKVLRGGEFYSQVAASERHEHVVLSELRQPHPRQVPQHEHELAYFTVVLDGDYAEGDRRGLTELHPFMAIFNPAGVAHTGLIGQTGASLFTIELRPEHLRELDFRLPSYPMVDPGTGAMLWPGLRLYSAFKSRTADALVLESHVMEMLGAIAGFRLRDRTAPHWFHRVRDRLRQEFRDGLRFSDLAAEAGVLSIWLGFFGCWRDRPRASMFNGSVSRPPAGCCATLKPPSRASRQSVVSPTRAISPAPSNGWREPPRAPSARPAWKRNPCLRLRGCPGYSIPRTGQHDGNVASPPDWA